jgi:crossover junction endodeoxyribonuclease RuvC
MSVTIAIDPGLSGAIALVDSYGILLEVHDMPVLAGDVSAQLLAVMFMAEVHDGAKLDANTYGCAVIEDVHSMPKQGVASSFKFGRGKGVVEGFFAGAGLPLRYVTPSKWKRDLGLTSIKGDSRQRALELWPEHACRFTRVKDEGRAEASLIGFWYVNYGQGR